MPLVSFHVLYLWIRQSSDRAESFYKQGWWGSERVPCITDQGRCIGRTWTWIFWLQAFLLRGAGQPPGFLVAKVKNRGGGFMMAVSCSKLDSRAVILSHFVFFSLWWTWTSLMVQTVKSLPARQQTLVRSLGQKDALEKGVMNLTASWPLWTLRGNGK